MVDGKHACEAHTKTNETGLVSEETDKMSAAMQTEMTHGTDAMHPAIVPGHLAGLAARESASTNPKELVVSRIALFSTFLACLETGHDDVAQQVLAQLHNGVQGMDLAA